jgi:hypothetical protein
MRTLRWRAVPHDHIPEADLIQGEVWSRPPLNILLVTRAQGRGSNGTVPEISEAIHRGEEGRRHEEGEVRQAIDRGEEGRRNPKVQSSQGGHDQKDGYQEDSHEEGINEEEGNEEAADSSGACRRVTAWPPASC